MFSPLEQVVGGKLKRQADNSTAEDDSAEFPPELALSDDDLILDA